MQDPKRSKECCQGGKRPREGEDSSLESKEIRLGDLYLAVGNVSDAFAYYKMALASVDRGDIEARREAVLRLSKCLRQQGKAEEAFEFVCGVEATFADRYKRDILAEKATLLCLIGRYGEAARVCEEAQAEKTGDDREKDARIYLVLGHVLARLCKWRQAIVCLEQAATFGRMCGDLTTMGNALNNLGIVYKNLCRLGESARFLRKAVRAARQKRDDASLAIRLLNLANTLFKEGDITRADRAISECIGIASRLNIQRTVVLASVCRARIEMAKGKHGHAETIAEEALCQSEAIDDPRLSIIAKETLGDALIAEGRLREARDLLEPCLRQLPSDAKDVEAELKSRLAEVYLALGAREAAEAHAKAAVSIAEAIGDLYEAGRAMRTLARVADDTSAHLDRAERIFTNIGARLELGRTLHLKARLLGGDRLGALQSIKDAITLFKASGASGLRVRALCDLALLYEDQSQHEKALTCLDEAASFASDDSPERCLIGQSRSKIDARLAARLKSQRPVSISETDNPLRALASNLGARGVVLASLSESGQPTLVRTHGMNSDVALGFAGLVASKNMDPFISTDLADHMPDRAMQGGFTSMVGMRIRSGGNDGILALCWHGSEQRGSMEPSLLVKAYYEACRYLEKLEHLIQPIRGREPAVCVCGMVTADRHLKRKLFSLRLIAQGNSNVLMIGTQYHLL